MSRTEQDFPINSTDSLHIGSFLPKGWVALPAGNPPLRFRPDLLSAVKLLAPVGRKDNALQGVHLVTKISHGEDGATGHFGADLFLYYWRNQHLIPENWKRRVDKERLYVYFMGTVIQDPQNKRYVLYLYWSPKCRVWKWNYRSLEWFWEHSDQYAIAA
jgi:hypothetical protein